MKLDAARAALSAYVANVGGEEQESLDTQLADLLADLMHLAEAESISWDRAIAHASVYADADEEYLSWQ